MFPSVRAMSAGRRSFANALDMATGLYDSDVDQADENAQATDRFFFPLDHAHKIGFACREYQRRSPPGTHWVYHSSDTYVLGTALNAFLRKQRDRERISIAICWPKGPGGRWPQSGAHTVTRRTCDQVAQPFTGYGLTLHRDDIAKLAAFLSTGCGTHRRQKPMLEPAMSRRALQSVPTDRGLTASTAEFATSTVSGPANPRGSSAAAARSGRPSCPASVACRWCCLPNGTTYYYVSDGNDFTVAPRPSQTGSGDSANHEACGTPQSEGPIASTLLAFLATAGLFTSTSCPRSSTDW
jgi:hypothetical protein